MAKECPKCLEMIPINVRRCRACTLVLTSLLMVLLLPVSAFAQDPNFKFAKPKEETKDLKGIEWKVLAKTGLMVTHGNSRATSVSGGMVAMRKSGFNKFSGEGNAAYVQSSVLTATDQNNNGTIDSMDELSRSSQTTANQWDVKLRYDRFLTENNSLYLFGKLGADRPAGKEVFGGGQFGYSRQIVKNDRNEFLSELGYDFVYESYFVDTTDPLAIHSVRFFLGYTLKLSTATSAYTNIEYLGNLSEETAPKEDGTTDVGVFEDSRLNWKIGLGTQLWKNLSLGLDFLMRYDNVPAPLSAFAGYSFAAGFVPVTEKLDTSIQASLIINFI